MPATPRLIVGAVALLAAIAVALGEWITALAVAASTGYALIVAALLDRKTRARLSARHRKALALSTLTVFFLSTAMLALAAGGVVAAALAVALALVGWLALAVAGIDAWTRPTPGGDKTAP